MKNNKGFTFVELLVVIALLSIVLILTISQVQRVNNNSKIKLCKNKLSLIEESLNLYLDNNRDLFSNSGLCEKEPVSNSCYTSVFKIAEQGIIDYDKNEKVINPVNNEDLNNYQVKIMYDSSTDKFSSEIQKKGKSVSDKNYDTICGKSDGIKEDNGDKSLFAKSKYDFNVIKIDEDGNETVINKGLSKNEIGLNEIGSYCKDIVFDGKDVYNNYVNYEKNGNIVNCRYKKEIRYSLIIAKDDNVILEDFNEEKRYKLNESVTIKVKFNQNYLYDENKSYCDVPESCEYNKEDSTIKITFNAGKDIKLTISSKDMLNVGMYYENPDEDNKYDTDASNNHLFATKDEAIEYCNNHIKENYTFDSKTGYNENTNGCYYQLKRTDLSFKLDDTNIVSVLVNPGSKTMSGTTSMITGFYKYGQKITLKVNYKNGYEYASIVCTGAECTLNDDGTITLVSYADSVSIAPKSRKIPPKYMIYHHYQDADDINGYSSKFISNDEPVNDSITESNLLATYCDATVGIYKYVSTISFYNSSNHEINCYYDRDESVSVTFHQSLYNVQHNSSLTGFTLKLIPNTSKDVATTTINLSSSETHKYRYGQEIVLTISGYANVPNKEPVTCNSNNECIINTNGTFKTTLSNNLTFKPGTVEYKVYNHYQDADDINGYSSTEVKDSVFVDMTTDDDTNYKNVCKQQDKKKNSLGEETYKTNESLSYLDSSKKEIDCYFDRNTYTVTFVKGNASAFDSHVSKINIVPASSIVLGLTSLTNNSTAIKYRHGQEIIINKSDFETDFQLDSVTCSDSNQCTIGKDGVARVTVPTNNNLKVYVKSKPTEIEYMVYHHYQDADDINGYTSNFVKTKGIVLSDGDYTNYNNECNQSKDGFTYNETISYLDRSKKEINCYYDRNESVSVTFDSKDLNNIKTNLSNFALTLTPNTSKDVATTTINLSSSGTHTYRHGQEIVLTISGYVNVPGVEPVTCNSNNECIINSNGTFKTTLNNKITFKPGTVEYKVYNHYQDVDNVNGFTSELADPVTIYMTKKDDINRDEVCNSQVGKSTHTLKKAISYLDSSRKEINCYFERN
mgnify:CR=1 FL=1